MHPSFPEQVLPETSLTWMDAWESAHYGPGGFYRLHENPNEHFRTSVMDSPQTSERIFSLILSHYKRIGCPDFFTVVDCGSGTGDLARDLVDLCSRNNLTWRVHETNFSNADIRLIEPLGGAGAVIAHELLDDIPCQVVEIDDSMNFRVVRVDVHSGTESLGHQVSEKVSEVEREWLERWWPATTPGARREIGITRDQLWRKMLSVFDAGCAIMVDYCTTHEDRIRGVFDAGTLAGYRNGRITRPIPDGTMNITAHVCLESLAGVGSVLGLPECEISRPEPHSDFHWLVQPL